MKTFNLTISINQGSGWLTLKIYKNLKSQAEAMQLIANPWEVEALLNGQNLIEGSEYNFAITKTEVK